jgi:predicted nuclease of predicted toxin-antitoxin system
MKFFLDENFPKTAAGLLVSMGHEVLDIRGHTRGGAEDKRIFEMAQAQNAVFLTTNRDFFHTIPHLYPNHCGIVVIALRQPNRKAITYRLSWFLERFSSVCSTGGEGLR